MVRVLKKTILLNSGARLKIDPTIPTGRLVDTVGGPGPIKHLGSPPPRDSSISWQLVYFLITKSMKSSIEV